MTPMSRFISFEQSADSSLHDVEEAQPRSREPGHLRVWALGCFRHVNDSNSSTFTNSVCSNELYNHPGRHFPPTSQTSQALLPNQMGEA